MSRDQRLLDNWALFHGWARAYQAERPFGIVFCIHPNYPSASERHYNFMVQGLKELSVLTSEAGIPFFILEGDPIIAIPRFVDECGASLLVTDFDPLRIKTEWKKAVAEKTECGIEEVDAHNIVPCWMASPKQEYSAATFRPKLLRHIPDHLEHLPPLPSRPIPWRGEVPEVRFERLEHSTGHDAKGSKGGWAEAERTLQDFIRFRLEGYSAKRDDPNLAWQSGMSPYLHFGMISAQSIALAVQRSSVPQIDKDAFLDELVVRRELSDNYCHYNDRYDKVEGFPAWSKATLYQHLNDRREYVYCQEELERSETHDPLWNAAQRQMVIHGKMHGWLRMYWAKKLLEWTETPEEALRIAISLNDHYELDGRDPNGYAGAAWSIGGVHDRAWGERPIFGKIRYMNLNGAGRKFDVNLFVSRIDAIT